MKTGDAIEIEIAGIGRLDHASSIARKKHDVALDLAYGPTPLERLDIFRAPTTGADVHVFFMAGTGMRWIKKLQLCCRWAGAARDDHRCG